MRILREPLNRIVACAHILSSAAKTKANEEKKIEYNRHTCDIIIHLPAT